MADDFDLADFGHVAEVFSLRFAQELGGVDFRNVEGRQLPCRFSRRGLLEDQAFVLVDVARGFGSWMLHRATSSTSSFAVRTERSLSAISPAAVSIALRVVSSVQHQSAALPSSG